MALEAKLYVRHMLAVFVQGPRRQFPAIGTERRREQQMARYGAEPMNMVAIVPTIQKAIAMVEAQPSQ
jgi:hypothetical protein